MIPSLAFQEAVRARLLADPTIALHVTPDRIRAGSFRPEQLPAIVITPTQTEILGRAAGRQIVAEVRMMLHCWAVADGTETGPAIAAAAVMALLDAPRTYGLGFDIDRWERPHLVWADQAAAVADASHGAIALRAVIRWPE